MNYRLIVFLFVILCSCGSDSSNNLDINQDNEEDLRATFWHFINSDEMPKIQSNDDFNNLNNVNSGSEYFSVSNVLGAVRIDILKNYLITSDKLVRINFIKRAVVSVNAYIKDRGILPPQNLPSSVRKKVIDNGNMTFNATTFMEVYWNNLLNLRLTRTNQLLAYVQDDELIDHINELAKKNDIILTTYD